MNAVLQRLATEPITATVFIVGIVINRISPPFVMLSVRTASSTQPATSIVHAVQADRATLLATSRCLSQLEPSAEHRAAGERVHQQQRVGTEIHSRPFLPRYRAGAPALLALARCAPALWLGVLS